MVDYVLLAVSSANCVLQIENLYNALLALVARAKYISVTMWYAT